MEWMLIEDAFNRSLQLLVIFVLALAHLLFHLPLCLEVACVVLIHWRQEGQRILYQVPQRVCLRGVIGNEAKAFDAKVGEYGTRSVVGTFIDGQSEGSICCVGIELLLRLQLIGFNFVHEAYSSAFVPLYVENDALAFVCDHLEGLGELVIAIASHAADRVTSKALLKGEGK